MPVPLVSVIHVFNSHIWMLCFYFLLQSRERKSGQSSSRLHASRPEATPLDFVVRPQSKIDPDEVRARAKQIVQDQRRLKVGFLRLKS